MGSSPVWYNSTKRCQLETENISIIAKYGYGGNWKHEQ